MAQARPRSQEVLSTAALARLLPPSSEWRLDSTGRRLQAIFLFPRPAASAVFTLFACWLSVRSKIHPDCCLTGSAVALSLGSARGRLHPGHAEFARALSCLARMDLIQLLSDLPPRSDHGPQHNRASGTRARAASGSPIAANA